jgi:hypothetical protein
MQKRDPKRREAKKRIKRRRKRNLSDTYLN